MILWWRYERLRSRSKDGAFDLHDYMKIVHGDLVQLPQFQSENEELLDLVESEVRQHERGRHRGSLDGGWEYVDQKTIFFRACESVECVFVVP